MREVDLNMQGLPIFRGIKAEEIERFIHDTACIVKKYERGTRILHAYGDNHKIGVIVKGVAQVVSEDRFGNEAVNHKLERGNMLGSNSAILPNLQHFHRTSVDSLTEMTILWIPYHGLLTAGTKLGRTHGMVMKNLLEAFCWKGIMMMEKIELLSQKTLRERLIIYLLQQETHQSSKRITVPGRVQLAKELECNRSALTREIAAMKSEGVLICGDDWLELDKDRIG